MKRTNPSSGQRHRWVVVAVCILGLSLLAQQATLAITSGQVSLGLTAQNQGNRLVVTWVQPDGLAWDKGVRPGDTVTSIDGHAVKGHVSPAALVGKLHVKVAPSVSGKSIESIKPISVDASPSDIMRAALDREPPFIVLVICFVLVSGIICVLIDDAATGYIVFGLSMTGATALLAAIATPFRASWALIVEQVAVTSFGAAFLLLFLVFPVNRLALRWGRWVAVAGLSVTVALLGAYAWVLVSDSLAFDWLHQVVFAVLAVDFAAAGTLAISALRSQSSRQREARPAVGLIVLGILTGLAPFFLLAVVPQALGFPPVVQPTAAILSIILVPISLGAAVLRRQLPGVSRLVTRGLVSLAVWMALVSAYTVGLNLVYGGLGAHLWTPSAVLPTVIEVAVIGATFAPAQQRLRRVIEHALFHDVYNYAEALQRLSNEIVRLNSVETIAKHILQSLADMLDLSWAALVVSHAGARPTLYPWGQCPDDFGAPLAQMALDPGWGDLATLDSQQSHNAAMLAPLFADGVPFGTLAVGPKRRDMDLLPEDRALVATLAPLVATALQNAQLTLSLEKQVAMLAERERELAALTARLMQAHEDERRRIALDLHDDPLQRAILLTREMSDISDSALLPQFRQAVEEIGISLRAICVDLRPPILDDLGLVAALEWLVSDLSARSDLMVSFAVEPSRPSAFERLEPGLEVALYRVAQEALANCLKHARASRVWVTLRREGQTIWLHVEDDGQGPHPNGEAADRALSLGILGMRERVRPWHGSVEIEPSPAGGTLVSAQVTLAHDLTHDLAHDLTQDMARPA